MASQLILKDNARSIWTRMLRRISLEEHLAPGSFQENSMTIEELIAICTRPLRLQHSIREGDILGSSATEIELLCTPPPACTPVARPRHVDVLSSGDDDSSLLLHLSWSRIHHPLFLCPGGRWVIGTAGNVSNGLLSLFCWDVSRKSTDGTIGAQKPAAQAICNGRWDGRAPSLICSSAGAGTRSVIVALKYSASFTAWYVSLN